MNGAAPQKAHGSLEQGEFSTLYSELILTQGSNDKRGKRKARPLYNGPMHIQLCMYYAK